MPAELPELSDYALCEVEDVADLLGYDDAQRSRRQRLMIRSINSASRAITRRGQCEFVTTEAEEEQTRFFLIESGDVRLGQLRVGGMAEVPTELKIWTPDRDVSTDLDPEEDIFLMPDTPEPGFPWHSIRLKSSAPAALAANNWLSVTTNWGFPEPPEDIVQIAIGTAASWILNDVQKLSEIARQQGRKIKFESLIPEEYLETVDTYRLYRVA